MGLFIYHINLDERGEFFADVRNSNDETVFELKTESDVPLNDLMYDMGMKHSRDLVNLSKHLVLCGIMEKNDILVGAKEEQEYRKKGIV